MGPGGEEKWREFRGLVTGLADWCFGNRPCERNLLSRADAVTETEHTALMTKSYTSLSLISRFRSKSHPPIRKKGDGGSLVHVQL